MDRRDFLKAGIASMIGLGSFTAAKIFTEEALAEITAVSEGKKAARWAMVIDVNKFQSDEDYQRCIDACHKEHNVPKFDNPQHEVKWIWKEDFEHSFPGQQSKYLPESLETKPFLLLCNHCKKPPCVRVCPTQATFKREDGIVMMDMHRCIGCRFCMAGCPFGARSFNWFDPRKNLKQEEINTDYPTRTKGVVEKCTFCAERLARNLEPACVEASNGAIAFGDLDDRNSEVRKILSTHYAITRKSELGTEPSVFYVISNLEGV
jgi:molybdopterin-containing oxidoreductase family iron-sulfur binding subunit